MSLDLAILENAIEAEETQTAEEPETTRSETGLFILPNDHQPITQAATEIFSVIGPTHTLFVRGGAIVELARNDDGYSLDLLKPEAFRSRLESYGPRLLAWKHDGEGKPVLKPKNCSADNASALLATGEARELLPKIKVVTNAPVLVESGKVLTKGYHPECGGILITRGDAPPGVPVDEAVKSLLGLLDNFDFQSEGDHGRAMAAFVTPCLKIGGFIRDSIPLDVAEADSSQSGKTYRQKIVRAIYGETAYPIASKSGGVGSVDESISAALISGRPFIALDNLRGKLDSQFLEMILTWDGPVPARVPHKGEVMVDASCVTFQLSSNGAETTRDLANRSSIIRIKKRPGHQFKTFEEGDLLAHVKARQAYYLGCVFAVVLEWINQGKPSSDETRHDFRQWAGILDYICQHIFKTDPLLDGHGQAQERVSNPALTWLRRVALAISQMGQIGTEFSASKLYALCEENAIEIPGLRNQTEEAGRKIIGNLMAKCFNASNEIEIDHLRIKRVEREEPNENRQMRVVKRYSVHSSCNLQPMQPTPITCGKTPLFP